jgi:hypothetical protein
MNVKSVRKTPVGVQSGDHHVSIKRDAGQCLRNGHLAGAEAGTEVRDAWWVYLMQGLPEHPKIVLRAHQVRQLFPQIPRFVGQELWGRGELASDSRCFS